MPHTSSRSTYPCSIAALLTVCATAFARPPERLWATEGMRTPESVYFAPPDSMLYVSNINGKPAAKDGNGFISRLSLDGDIVDLQWASGLNAPKGSVMSGGRLYVADIDRLVAIDAGSGKTLDSYTDKRAGFLNDITADNDGTVYVSDMSAAHSCIYRLADGSLEPWLTGKQVARPNGMCVVGDSLYFGTYGSGVLYRASLADKSITEVAKTGWGIDGLVPDGAGGFYVSDWNGRVAHVSGDGTVEVIIDTRDDKVNAADIEYIPERNLLLVPTFFDDRVVAYRIRR